MGLRVAVWKGLCSIWCPFAFICLTVFTQDIACAPTVAPTSSPVQAIRFNDKYEGAGQDQHGATVECYGAASCSTDRYSNAVDIRSEDYVQCYGYKACDGAAVEAKRRHRARRGNEANGA